ARRIKTARAPRRGWRRQAREGREGAGHPLDPPRLMIDISLSALAAQMFTGLVLGMIFVLLAIGLSLIFGLMTVVNFSHGAFYMLGAYLGFFLVGATKSFWLALIVAPLLVGVLGLGVERF